MIGMENPKNISRRVKYSAISFLNTLILEGINVPLESLYFAEYFAGKIIRANCRVRDNHLDLFKDRIN